MEQEKRRIGMEIKRLNHLLCRNIEASVRAEGIDTITLMHGWIIRYLYENQNNEIFQKDIEKQFCIGRSTVTNIIQLMEKKGYLRREEVKRDARLKRVVLTEMGIKTHENIEKIITILDEQMLNGISEEELGQFYAVAEKLIQNLELQQKKAIERGGEK